MFFDKNKHKWTPLKLNKKKTKLSSFIDDLGQLLPCLSKNNACQFAAQSCQ